jgi:hypothetical protein
MKQHRDSGEKEDYAGVMPQFGLLDFLTHYLYIAKKCYIITTLQPSTLTTAEKYEH